MAIQNAISIVRAKLGKRPLAGALQGLVDAGMLSQGEAEQAAG